MPLHDVKCSRCGHVEEILYLPGDKPSTVVCNNCDHPQKFRALLSSPKIVMGGQRPVESEIEQAASDGLF